MPTLVDRHSVTPATERPAWRALKANYQELRKVYLRELFAGDSRFMRIFVGRASVAA